MIDLTVVIEAAHELDPLPASATRLATLSAQEDVRLVEVAETVSFDPPLAGRVLRAANSAAFASASRVGTVGAAVQRLGIGRLLALAVGPAVRRQFSGRGQTASSEMAMWTHAVAASLAVESMPRHCSVRIPTEAITAALLHDVGKLVLLRFTDSDDRDFLRRAWLEGGRRRFEAEREILGCDHAELGGLVAQYWGLPDPIRLAVTHHHDPDPQADPAVDAVFMANAIAHAAGLAEIEEVVPLERHAEARRRLGLTLEGFEAICSVVKSGVEDVLKRYA